MVWTALLWQAMQYSDMINLKQDLKIKLSVQSGIHKVTNWTDHNYYDIVTCF